MSVKDPNYQLLVQKVTNGDWGSHELQELACLRPFYRVRDRFVVAGSLVTPLAMGLCTSSSLKLYVAKQQLIFTSSIMASTPC